MSHTSAQNWLSVLKSRFSGNEHQNQPFSRRRRSAFRPQIAETLEDRIVMSANVLYDHPGTTFDANLFATNIESTLNQNTVGYGYSISIDGQQGPAGGGGINGTGGGVAVSAIDIAAITGAPVGFWSPISFTEDTRIEVASVSKNITAVALLHAIQNHPFADIDQPMAAYLPSSWTLGNNLEQISIRNLLTHTSGFGENYAVPTTGTNTEVGIAASAQLNITFNTFNNNTYANLQSMVAYGVENTYPNPALDDIPQIGNRLYSNANYSLMRMILPIISGDVAQDETDPQAYADAFRDYVNDNLFVPAGINDAQLFDNSQLQARVYRSVSADPGLNTPGITTGTDRTLVAGGFGWHITANDLAAYLRYVYQEDTSPLNPAMLQEMRDGMLGFSPGNTQLNGNYGAYYAHDGQFTGAGSNSSTWQRMRSSVTVFPNDVQASLIVNSIPDSTSVTSTVLQNAYNNSWPEVAIGGSTLADTFTLDVIGNNIRLTIDAGNSPVNEIFTAPISILERLTLVGYGGNDTFIVNGLPESVQLVIDAGIGSDTLELTPAAAVGGQNLDAINDRITFRGGPLFAPAADTDIVNIYDGNNLSSDTYYVASTWFDKSGFERLDYQRVDQVNLWAGSGNDTIHVNSLSASMALTVDSGSGDDRVYIGGANLSGNIHGRVEIVTGNGDDQLIFDDRNGTVADDFYVFQENYFQSAVIPVIEWDTDAPPERIVLQGSNQNSTTNIQGVLDGVRLSVHGRGGNDAINLHAVSPGGQANLIGGAGNDTISLTPTGRNLDTIQGRVFATGEAGTFDRIVLNDQNNSDNGRNYRFTNNRFDVVGSPFDQLIYTGSVETLEIQAGDHDDLFDVRSTSVSTLVSLFGNSGSDTLNVAGSSQDLDSIDGSLYFSGGSGDGTDLVVLHDEQDTGNDTYSLYTDPPSSVTKPGFQFNHFGVEELTLNANSFNNWIVIGGAFALQTTDYTINTGDGRDTVTVNASAPMVVTVNGGAGTPDHVRVFGTAQDDTVTLRSDRVELGATTVVFGSGIERRSLDTGAGLDLLIVEGQQGVNERFVVRSSTVPGSGSVTPTPFAAVTFTHLEDVDVRGNAADRDTLLFHGTNENDSIDVNPVAQGTMDSPVVRLGNSFGTTLLRLRDFSNVAIPTVSGLAGADTFRVTIFPTQPDFVVRDIRLDGGTQPAVRPGSRPIGDTLIVNFNENLFAQLPSSIGPTSGRIRLGHDDDILDILFVNFEELSGNLNVL